MIVDGREIGASCAGLLSSVLIGGLRSANSPYGLNQSRDGCEMSWTDLDQQMASWASRLIDEVKVSDEHSRKLATSIAGEIRFLPPEAKVEITSASPVQLELRIQELQAFQGWMDLIRQSKSSPFMTRAQVITQNYVCFVYLPESCFRVLSKVAPSGSAARKCAQFLSNNPVRAFRNAIAHANWCYRDDYQAIVYWARKGSDPDEPLRRYEVAQEDLSFWQSLSRCVAYAAFSNLS